ncbi:alpha/beta fold hydrolase [Umboniibacter marinipuniceus]|uniref:Pimeloyl-ACP methyl ester carboxylesterase n=1 Tax=Umboniibacter marinipuniceus TaxID=569599 RepID=A0A3M0A6X9_9GAMM|nr:alpha/beta hydrolase [Umboniibacter marinipuniceus]RMA79289.1 pimeloyl-ACP methyl ester carboxylesterase [Umboniibacter marinipuniceus]
MSLVLNYRNYRTTKGLNVAYYESENIGRRPVLVFVHGNGFSPRTYEKLFTHLAENFDLFLPEVQGHGGNPATGNFEGWNEWAEAIAELIQTKRADWINCIGSGHSFGGVLTTLIAAKHSSLFDQLILLDPIYLPRRSVWFTRLVCAAGLGHLHPMIAMTRRRREHFPSKEAVCGQLQGKGVFDNWDPEALSDFADANFTDVEDGVRLTTSPDLEAQIFGSYARRLRAAIKRITIPMHVLYGDKTYPFQQRAILEVAQLNAKMKLYRESGGHCFMQENPEKIAKKMLSLYDNNNG